MKHLLISLTAGFSNARVGENLGIRYIKSYLNKHGYCIDILENQFYNFDSVKLAEVINEYDVIGFSINYCGQVQILEELLKIIDTKDKIIYLGGHFASICYDSLLKDFIDINFIMIADGELSTLQLIREDYKYEKVNNVVYLDCMGNLVKNRVSLVDNLDDLEFPYRDENSFYLGDNHFSMISSRGCYNRCSYCSVGSFTQNFFNNAIRFRSAEDIVEEILELSRKYNVKYITFLDDLFVGTDKNSQERARKFANLIIENGIEIFFSIQCSVKSIDYEVFSLLYKAGLRNVLIGIENFSQNALKYFNKFQDVADVKKSIALLQHIGIPISYGFIMYYPEMENKEILENISILKDLNLLNLRAITSVLQIYIGTDYCNRTYNNLDVERNNYLVKYKFKDNKLINYIEQCKNFKMKYCEVEEQLYRMEFLSHSDKRFDKQKIDFYFSKFRECIYLFAFSKYYEIFLCEELFTDYKYKIEDLRNAIREYSDSTKMENI